MGLAQYKQKRDFKKSPEPAAKKSTAVGASYVIQKHDASRLHYDFRLEMDGVLKSWAVPKGPSLDPKVKRLAVQVEDHPVNYGSFEGTIPKGQYGGGTVMLWDKGNWEPVGDPHKSYRAGRLKFILHGEKLHGGWTLVRTRQVETTKSPQWLLIKERDDDARSAADGDILDESPLSVETSRDLDEIANDADRIWNSESNSKLKTPKHVAGNRKRKSSMAMPDAAIEKALPKTFDVQLATLVERAPTGNEWLHEVKFDGYRMICRIDRSDIQFITRNHNDWTEKLSSLIPSARKLSCTQAVLDGEIVVLRDDGTTDFQLLQNAFRQKKTTDLKYYVFDLLYLNGKSLVALPLELRKSLLQNLLEDRATSLIYFSDHVVGNGDEFKKQACRLHLEGMISKRRDRPYQPGRGFDWLKVKCIHDEELVIGGFTEPGGSRTGFGALLVGFFDDRKYLHYAGKVGTGFSDKDLHDLHRRMTSLEQVKSPFFDFTKKSGPARTAHWLQPVLVGQFKYASRTNDDKLRHASFQGLREDKKAVDVKIENPIPVKKATANSTPGRKPGNRVATTKSARKTSSSIIARDNADDGKSIVSSEDYDEKEQQFSGERLTHPDKVLYPDSKITKLELASYYQAVADWILPHLAHRPVVLVRCPDGIGKGQFYQKHPGAGASASLRQIPIRESQKSEKYGVVDDLRGLIAAVQMSALELHVWGSREDKIEQPDRLIFDLDPDPLVKWPQVIDGALQIAGFLNDLGLQSFVKTTGGKGLHVCVPIARRHEWSEVKAFCKQVAEAITRADPDHYTSNMSKAARSKKIFVDYLRNGRGATAVAAYSTRARPGAPVSMPLSWNELKPEVNSDQFTIRNAIARLASLKQDPWKEMSTLRQSLTTPMKRLKAILDD